MMRWAFSKKRRDRDLDDEIAHDLAAEAEERMRDGVSREEAESFSRRDFGNALLVKEELRDMMRWTTLERLAQDLRYALRTLRTHPLFASMAVITLALGIGANTAIYSFMDAILMRALPVQHPDELVILTWHSKDIPAVAHNLEGSWFNDPHTGWTSGNHPFAAFEMLRKNEQIFSQLFAYAGSGRLNLIVRGQAELAGGQFVSGRFFDGLGVSPAAGRLLNDEDDRMGATPVVVISYKYWQQRFGAGPEAVGQTILIDRTPFTIAGVAAAGFFGVNPAGAPDLFLPLHSAPSFAANPQRDAERRFVNKNSYWVEMMGRLRPSVSAAQAQTALAEQYRQLVSSTASTEEERANLPSLIVEEGGSGTEGLRRQYSRPLYVLMTLVGLILMIACANIASLLLARAAARRREIAVRLSLGASRLRVIRQLLTESLLLASIGGVLGLWVAALGIRFITWLLENGNANFTLHAELNWPVLGFALGLTLLTGVVFGLAPAMRSTRLDVTPALKESRASGGSGRRLSLGQVLVAAQIGISLLLVIAAGLFVRTLVNLQSVPLGFNRENVLLFNLNPKQAGYRDAALAQFYADLWTRFRTIPGVRAVTLSDFPLVSNAGWDGGVSIPGVVRPPGREPGASFLKVGPTFFTVMQIPVLQGREIEERDILNSAKVAVVNEVFAKKYFGGQNPVGRHIGLEDDPAFGTEIIGLAKTARYHSIKKDVPPVVYAPYSQNLARLSGMTFEVRTSGDPLALAPAIREMVRQSSPLVPISNVKTQASQIDQTIGQERTFAELCACFALLALVISCVGLYGTMAYAVARRTSEIGIRMALGAQRGRILRMVLGEVGALVVVGVVLGLGAAWGASRYVESFLFGMTRHDPVAVSLSIAVLVVAAMVAGYAPAARAARVDPMQALRHE